MSAIETSLPNKDRLLYEYKGTSAPPASSDAPGAKMVLCKLTLSYDEREKKPGQEENTIPTEALYPLSDELSPVISTAFRLLEEAINKISEAYESLSKGNLIAADDALIHVTAILPELFCCKSIGDGFGATINAIFYGIKNQSKEEEFHTLDQINMIRFCLKRLQSEPFIEFSDSVGVIMKLEDAGFNVDPPHLNSFMDLINA
jgi:hypothetical protein